MPLNGRAPQHGKGESPTDKSLQYQIASSRLGLFELLFFEGEETNRERGSCEMLVVCLALKVLLVRFDPGSRRE